MAIMPAIKFICEYTFQPFVAENASRKGSTLVSLLKAEVVFAVLLVLIKKKSLTKICCGSSRHTHELAFGQVCG